MSAQSGYDGRLSPPPPGGVYVRDPAEARAKAIRDRVKLLSDHGQPIPDHLQRLFDQLPVEAETVSDVELVDQTTGEVEGRVDVLSPAEMAEGSYGTVAVKPAAAAAPDPLADALDDAPPDEPLVVEEVPAPEPEPVPEPAATPEEAIARAAKKLAAEAKPAAAEPLSSEGNLGAQVKTATPTPSPRPRGRPRKVP